MDINYRNQIINVDWKGQFEIVWHESIIDEVKQSLDSFDTLQKAKDLIDAKLRILAKKEPLNLAALTSSGVPIKITGIHLGTHNVLSSPTFERYAGGVIYLDHAYIRSQLARLKAIKEEVKEINDALSVYTIKTSYGYGRMEVAEYEKYIAQLKESYAAAEANLNASSPE